MYFSRGSLLDRVDRHPLSLAEALCVGVQLCGALEAAHRGEILHRDVKLANVLLNRFGAIGLPDFGVAAR